VIHILAVPQNY